MFSIFEQYLEILNLLNLNQERLVLTKLPGVNVNLKKENYFVVVFNFIGNFFRVKDLFIRRYFGQIYEVVKIS